MQDDVYDKASFSVMWLCYPGAPLYSSIPTGKNLKKKKKKEKKKKQKACAESQDPAA